MFVHLQRYKLLLEGNVSVLQGVNGVIFLFDVADYELLLMGLFRTDIQEPVDYVRIFIVPVEVFPNHLAPLAQLLPTHQILIHFRNHLHGVVKAPKRLYEIESHMFN